MTGITALSDFWKALILNELVIYNITFNKETVSRNVYKFCHSRIASSILEIIIVMQYLNCFQLDQQMQ